MTIFDGIQIVVFFAVLIALVPPLGSFMARVFEGKRTFLSFIIRPIERATYSLSGIHESEEMTWKTYAWSLLAFNLFGIIILFLIQIFQNILPFNPQKFSGVTPLLALNTAVSFVTNTNWQSYAGETTLSYFTQMIGLTVQNFVSAATGIAVFLAITRGLIRHSVTTIGNFWVDLVRCILYILLPLSIVLSIALMSQGVIQTFSSYKEITTIEGKHQTIPLGPAASQIAIKQLGTNGGGYFNANSTHPFENPTPLSNFFELLSILLIPASLTFTFGKMVNDQRQGWSIFHAMMLLFVAGVIVSLIAEYSWNPIVQTFGSLEGKEVRFGIANSVLWSTATTAASNGSVNAMHSSLSPLSGFIAMFNMMLGEVVFGGVGAGMYGVLMFIVLTVFIAGLMVGRTPEYLGKKIESFEIKMAVIAVLAPGIVILLFTALSITLPHALSSLSHSGPHGLSEMLYAFTSASANNGSAFAGINTNTNYYNILLSVAMLIGRFVVIVPVLAIAGSLSVKKSIPSSSGTFPTNGFLFTTLLIGVIIIVGALTFFPALTLGPILEHFLMIIGKAI